jgi:hypothetical protein
MTGLQQEIAQPSFVREVKQMAPLAALFHNLGLNLSIGEDQTVGGTHLSGGLDQGLPGVQPDFSEEQDLDRMPALRSSEEPPRAHLGVVDDQKVTRHKMVSQIAKDPVPHGARVPVQNKEARPITLSGRELGDQLGRQQVVKVDCLERDRHR